MLPCAKSGHPESQFTVGIILDEDDEGMVVEDDTERERESLDWIRKAAISGHDSAIYHIVGGYTHGWYGLPKNRELEQCWRSAAEDKNQITLCLELEKALLGQGEDIGKGDGLNCDDSSFEELVEELFARDEFRELYEISLPCAEAGDPEIQFGVGRLI